MSRMPREGINALQICLPWPSRADGFFDLNAVACEAPAEIRRSSSITIFGLSLIVLFGEEVFVDGGAEIREI